MKFNTTKAYLKFFINAINMVLKEKARSYVTDELLDAATPKFNTLAAPFIANHLAKRNRAIRRVN
jgi:hypothetical protein